MKYSLHYKLFSLKCVLFSTRQFDHKSFSASFKLGERRQRRLERITSIRNIINVLESYTIESMWNCITIVSAWQTITTSTTLCACVLLFVHMRIQNPCCCACAMSRCACANASHMCTHVLQFARVRSCTNLEYNKIFVSSGENAHHVHAPCTGNLVDILVHSVIYRLNWTNNNLYVSSLCLA